MINQIAAIKTQTAPLTFNKDLAKARHIQARLKTGKVSLDKPDRGIIWSPITAGPYVVPVLRWIE